MKIDLLICDDDQSFVERLADLIRKQPLPDGTEITIEKSYGNESLSKQLLMRSQIIFLDIDMGERSGMDIARNVRQLHSEAILIFVTNYPQFSLEGYEVRAFRYLLKRDLEQKLPTCFQQALAEILHTDEVLRFSVSGETYMVPYKNIIYLESRRRIIYLHTQKPERVRDYFYATIEKMTKELEAFGFLRVQKSYLVNMAYIHKLNYDRVLLNNGEELPVSQKHYAEIKARYLEWKSKQWRDF